MANDIPIVQYADKNGNRGYSLTHWDAIKCKPDFTSLTTLTSPNGTKYELSVDDDGTLTTKEVTDATGN